MRNWLEESEKPDGSKSVSLSLNVYKLGCEEHLVQIRIIRILEDIFRIGDPPKNHHLLTLTGDIPINISTSSGGLLVFYIFTLTIGKDEPILTTN